jgi:hypothetical protein
MTSFHASLLVWGSFIVLGVTLELLAWRDAVPWNTLTWTIGQLFARSAWSMLIFVGLLAAFAAHILFRKKSKLDDPEGRN